MTKKTGEMVVYIGEGKIIAGPLSSESDMLEHFLIQSNFERKVLPCKNLGELISKANGLLAASRTGAEII
jgi:hypothetical protein